MLNILSKLILILWSILERVLPWQISYYVNYTLYRRRIPNLKYPRDYSEFIFRDNLLQRHNKLAFLADKYTVREYVKERGLGSTLTELYGVWDYAEKIDFGTLPNKFVLKCNHSCGMNIVCYDKSKLDFNKTVQQLSEWERKKHPFRYESHYYEIKPLIICEELIPNNYDGYFPIDYKIHCANGKAIFIQCCFERDERDESKMVTYTPSWERKEYILHNIHYTDADLPKPKHLVEMIEAAEILSSGLDYVRIDLYDTPERVFFGEITLTPQGGWLSNLTDEIKIEMGNYIRKDKGNEC